MLVNLIVIPMGPLLLICVFKIMKVEDLNTDHSNDKIIVIIQKIVRVTLWDTVRQERYRILTSSCYKGV